MRVSECVFLFFSCGNIRNPHIERCIGCQNMCNYTGCDIIHRIRTECTRPLYMNCISESRTTCISHELCILEFLYEMILIISTGYGRSALVQRRPSRTIYWSHELYLPVTNYVYSNSYMKWYEMQLCNGVRDELYIRVTNYVYQSRTTYTRVLIQNTLMQWTLYTNYISESRTMYMCHELCILKFLRGGHLCNGLFVIWGNTPLLPVSFAEYHLFHRALLQKKPIILRSLLIVATPYLWKHSVVCVTLLPNYRLESRTMYISHELRFAIWGNTPFCA